MNRLTTRRSSCDEQGGAVGKGVVLAGGRRDAAEQQRHGERREAVERGGRHASVKEVLRHLDFA